MLRLAKSWFRFGSFEILADANELDLLRRLTDFVINNYFPDIDLNDPHKYVAFFSKVVESTAKMIAKWQSVGFAHGVCNTDNFSILSITIDYGPFGFLDDYEPGFVPNTSDDEGRYSYENQPDVGRFNLDKLRLALNDILNRDQQKQLEYVLAGYNDIYKFHFMKLFRKKLGLDFVEEETDEEIIAYLLHIMEQSRSDFTMTFRDLSDWDIESITNNRIQEHLWALKHISSHDLFENWRKMYLNRLKLSNINDEERQYMMKNANPRYILRNWIAENAIKHTENKDFEYIKTVYDVLKSPYQVNLEAEKLGFADRPPFWAKQLKVNCSS